MATPGWMRVGAVAVSAVAFGWVIAAAQGGCGTDPPEPAASQPHETPAPQADVKQPSEPPPSATPPSETPTPEPAEPAAAEKPAVYFSASKSGGFEFDDDDSAGVGVGGIRPADAPGKGNNAGAKPKAKPKAFFPASKSGRVREPAPQVPNAPPTK